MSELTAAVGGGFEFKQKDKTYHVSLITQKIKAAFEKAQFNRARDAALALKDLMTRDEYLDHLKALNDDFISGAYGLESERGMTFAQSSNGSIVLSSLLFNISEDEMVKLLLECRDEITQLLSLVIKESFGTLDENSLSGSAASSGSGS